MTGVANAFSDVAFTDKIYPATQYLNSQGVIKGYSDNTFQPDKVINRAEAVKIILSAAEIPVLESISTPSFRDVPSDSWFAPFVEQGLTLKIVTPQEKFDPTREVNRAEFLKMMCLALQVDPNKYTLDVKSVDAPDDAWFAPYINFAIKFDILDRAADQKAFPEKSITRREAADMLFRTLQKGHALRVQTLLDLTENQLIATLQFLELQKLPEASLSI
ncbi:S-layer homology domain-containing protein, partial [Candidatus Gracilibacteria bacterium]|nr:S-layer homology domain-containing protein [Candidatus Gracilibacteria bacterium]